LALEGVDWKKEGHQTNPWLCIFCSPFQGTCKEKRFITRPNLCGYVISYGFFVPWPRAGRPSTREGGPRVQNHDKLNVRVLISTTKRAYKEFIQAEARWRRGAEKEWLVIEDQVHLHPVPEHCPLLCRVVSPYLQELLGISAWGIGFISSKKLVDFETHDLLLDELRKNKLRNIKDIRNAFKHENKSN
jgi:hypothetical protein